MSMNVRAVDKVNNSVCRTTLIVSHRIAIHYISMVMSVLIQGYTLNATS